MRTTVPAAFNLDFVGPEGVYTIHFRPTDDWDGVIDVSIDGRPLRWHVVSAEKEADGTTVLGGMTDGTKPLWGDMFWFELRFADAPAVIRYWGDQVLWREDVAV